jgi:hypothetical protein
MKLFLSLTWLLFLSVYSPIQAQWLKQGNAADISLSSNGAQSAISAAIHHYHQLGKSKKFGIGYGLRYTGNFGSNSDFITAPATLTSGKTGPGVLASETILANLDTLNFASHQVNSFNLAIYLNYAITKKLKLEFNIDAVGFSFGSNQTSEYTSSKRSLSPNQDIKQPAKVTGLNALLISDNDIGSLNSEILVRYSLNSQWTLKAGAAFIFTEFTTDNPLYLNNDRFRNKSLQPMLGLSYQIN